MAEFNAVVALDGSQISEASLKYLPLLKALEGLHLHLIGVVDVYAEGVETVGIEKLTEREHGVLEAYLSSAASQLGQSLGVPVAAEVRDGHADEEILGTAERTHADLIVMTTHGRSGLGRWSTGSVADKVLRTAGCDTLVIGPDAARREAPQTIANILVPLDGSDLSEQALQVATSWAKATRAKLHLVRCFLPPAIASEALVMPEIFEGVRDAAEAYIRETAAALAGVDVQGAVILGAAVEQLTAYCEANQIDLVVMASHGRHGLLRAVIGSVTDRMLHGPAPVLVVHPG